MARTTCRTPAPPGTVELLPSGRWRAFYRRDGWKFAAPHTFDTRADGHAWIAAEIADRLRGTWRDPSARQTTLADYAHTWLSARPDLAPRTAAVYRHLIERWVLPRRGAGRGIELGARNLTDLTPTVVRAWYAALFTDTTANAERLRARPTPRRAGALERITMTFPTAVTPSPGARTLLDSGDIAEIARITPRMARRLLDERRLPTVKVGRHVRVWSDDLYAWLDQNTHPANP